MSFRLISNFAQVTGAIEKSLPKQCLRACHEVRNEWVRSLTGTRSGRQYRIPGTKRFYTASAAGEAPARRMGDLARSIRVMPRFELGLIQARVGSDLDYAFYTEYGTKTMSPRPHLRPAKDRAMPAIRRIFSEGLI